MFKRLAPVLLLTALASCGAAGENDLMTDNITLARFAMNSEDISDGQPIDPTYTCDGADQSPQLSWPAPPPETKSFALVMDDPDAPSGIFRHWGAYDIPASQTSMDRGAGNSSSSQFKQATNDFSKPGYGGPCPPQGHGPHHYRFKLYALDVDRLDVPPGASVADVELALQPHKIALGQITGTYERK